MQNGVWTALLDLLIPPRCEVCNTLQEPVICAGCLQGFTALPTPRCRQCDLPLDPLAHTDEHCAACRDDPPPFDAARAAGLYGSTLRQAIHVFKYEMVRALARPLADYALTQLTLPFPVDCLCPVPLHHAREAMRGFNQSLLLAEHFGQCWQLPVAAELLIRTQNTTPQMLLPLAQRRENVKGVFRARETLAACTVGLVDDVFTTGATLRECSSVLKRAGAQRVLVITLARAARQL
ncbi:MAG TPA: ComF family protein [Armatimonadota bacterium]